MPPDSGEVGPTSPGLELIRKRHSGLGLTTEDVFHYVYGIFHSPEYRTRFHNNLFREIPRIPVVDQPEKLLAIIRIGRELGNLHCRYEALEPWPITLDWQQDPKNLSPEERYRCEKRMKWAGVMANRDWTTLRFNQFLTLRDIPTRAWTYRVGRVSALKTVRNYQFSRRDRRTGHISDGDTYSSDPRYTLDLFGKVIRVAMNTLDLMERIPPLFED